MPELAMIRFVVFDEDVGSRDDFIGQFSLPFTSVRPGMLLYLSLLYCLNTEGLMVSSLMILGSLSNNDGCGCENVTKN